ncbi:hemerythrin domain-containing protein [Acrocarpospora phusangensis]|uniref:hemerythrin domain-containing protein n=1 Tax=Acrocarpospora phusangensis TaxID=1070424 RepID=UPI00194F565A|nr:hemerythrin domain-containing protein [Acrocarpospora phusangensis]
MGNQLIDVHIWLREELAELRESLGDGRPKELQAHCLAFCSALERHHTGEDAVAFPQLAEEFPELRPTLESLSRDHLMVTSIMGNLQALLDGLGPAASPAERTRALGELDGLAALLDSHFAFEERKLTAALNSLRHTGPTPDYLLPDEF